MYMCLFECNFTSCIEDSVLNHRERKFHFLLICLFEFRLENQLIGMQLRIDLDHHMFKFNITNFSNNTMDSTYSCTESI